MNQQKIELLAFAPHPDDAEISCGGLLAKMSQAGHKTAIVDLTEGELATNGDVATRRQEAAAAAEVLGLTLRENLAFPDGQINKAEDESLEGSQLRLAVETLRRLRPEIVLIPHNKTRHPDHGAASELLTKAVFFAGVEKFSPQSSYERFSPTQVLYYMMRYEFKPSFLVDISEAAESKMKALHCYKSQLYPSGGKETLINSPETFQIIDTRDRYFGAMAGCSHAEAFLSHNSLSIPNPIEFFQNFPNNKAQIFQTT